MLSLLIRRTHMYLALFLAPWMLMYAVSTLVMTHRTRFAPQAPFQAERSTTFDAVFPDNVDPRQVSEALLASLGLEGSHMVTRRKDGTYVVNRADLLTPRRLTYTPADRRVVIERLPLQTSGLMNRFHRRRGYATGYALDTTWAVTVDVAIAAMMFWALSGLWMWWEMKATRGWGLVAGLGGAGLFAFYLLTL